jgi:DNA polymerase III subunit chi
MTEISFYHLERQSLDQVLPKLLERVIDAGLRAVVLAGSEERVDRINALLWTYDEGSFLPHGAKVDGNLADQPIYLTTEEENPNAATVLAVIDGIEPAHLDRFDRCLELFNGNDDGEVAAARERWQKYKAGGHEVVYWQQSPQGKWEKKG